MSPEKWPETGQDYPLLVKAFLSVLGRWGDSQSPPGLMYRLAGIPGVMVMELNRRSLNWPCTGLVGPSRAFPSQCLPQYVYLPREDQPEAGTQRILQFLHTVSSSVLGILWGSPFSTPIPIASPLGPLQAKIPESTCASVGICTHLCYGRVY